MRLRPDLIPRFSTIALVIVAIFLVTLAPSPGAGADVTPPAPVKPPIQKAAPAQKGAATQKDPPAQKGDPAQKGAPTKQGTNTGGRGVIVGKDGAAY
jgi:hypothetical protein